MVIPNRRVPVYALLASIVSRKRRACCMKHKVLSILVGGLAATGLLYRVAIADPGNGHGPPPGKGPNGPKVQQTPGNPAPGNPSSHGSSNKGNASCKSGCQQARRQCIQNATGDRKACYKQGRCADLRDLVKGCRGGGDGVTDNGSGDGVSDNGSGDGVSDNGNGDQGGGCSAEAHALVACLKDCRTALTVARQNCPVVQDCVATTCGAAARSASQGEPEVPPTPTPTPLP
jgi:hypothetical protein